MRRALARRIKLEEIQHLGIRTHRQINRPLLDARRQIKTVVGRVGTRNITVGRCAALRARAESEVRRKGRRGPSQGLS